MKTTMLTAYSAPGGHPEKGRQYIARILVGDAAASAADSAERRGDKVYSLQREFLARGGASASAEVGVGLYELAHTDPKRQREYVMVWDDGSEWLAELPIDGTEIADLARQSWDHLVRVARVRTIAEHRERVALGREKDPAGQVQLARRLGPHFAGSTVARAEVIRLREAEIARLSGTPDPVALRAERQRLADRLAEIDRLLEDADLCA